MTYIPIGLYRPGRTILHRTPAGAKLVALTAVSLLLMSVTGPWSTLVALGLALALVGHSGIGIRPLLRTVRGLAIVAAALTAHAAWQRGWASAFEPVGDLVALVLLSTVLTATTSVEEVLDTLVAAAGPLRRVGIDPERFALACSLAIRSIPTIAEIAVQTRDAALARGLQRDLRARLVPLVVRTVAHAYAVGDALTARGILETESDPAAAEPDAERNGGSPSVGRLAP